eukprot:CAMPEP_0197944758 /NCGR_PEP_ID=MMETSP1439-20131203/125570_1 /TAXON_ID=66791 /ORGANISM="Gonyaulax spinifera, Strain CCMP409" /LENGTH=162 /DNA_ID=CAMNT_0043568013 /DNA_START=759 /DNA_END=1248 /DNA_ORIENTATION=+
MTLEPGALEHHEHEGSEDRARHHDCGVLHPGEDASDVEDDQPQRGRGHVELDDAHVRDPPPLVRIDLAHRLPPAHVVDALRKVPDGEGMQAHQAKETRDPERPEAVLREVPPHPAPVVGVKVCAGHSEDNDAQSKDSNGILWPGALVGHGVQGSEGHERPAA